MSIEAKASIWGTLIGCLLMAAGLYWWPSVEPHASNQLERALLLQTVVGLNRGLLVFWLMKIIDWGTDGNWGKAIGENPYAAAAVYIAVIWAVVSGMSLIPGAR